MIQKIAEVNHTKKNLQQLLYLQKTTNQELRKIAKLYGIDIRGISKKVDLVFRVLKFSKRFSLIHLNPFFTGKFSQSSLISFIKSNRCQIALKMLVSTKGVCKEDLLIQDGSDFFIYESLALLAAPYIWDTSLYGFYKAIVHTRLANTLQSLSKRIKKLELRLADESSERGKRVTLDWVSFKVHYGLVIIKTKGVYVISGLNPCERLDKKLSRFLVTYPEHELVLAAQCKNRPVLEAIEKSIMLYLNSHQTGVPDKMGVGSYCLDGTGIDINSVVLRQFKWLNIEQQGFGSICPIEFIAQYNRKKR
jgi:hypothetical protein